ncbi:hypothetical protein AMECASPLE_025516 [Ameca splendens]|uniref:Secreted protein n=1 Tax=Ameca splendens TaxID=208324 RepID=A0ABV1ACD8_9TELE
MAVASYWSRRRCSFCCLPLFVSGLDATAEHRSNDSPLFCGGRLKAVAEGRGKASVWRLKPPHRNVFSTQGKY